MHRSLGLRVNPEVAAMLVPSAYARSMSIIACSYAAGDVACQWLESSAWSNPRRTAEFALVGGGLMAPMSHSIEAGLEHIFPGATTRQILKKVLFRVAVAPIFLSVSFGSIALLRSESVENAVRSKVIPAWQTGSLFWPGVSFLTYRLVPLPARPATGAVVGSVWSCYLSWVAFTKSAVGE